MGWEKQDDSETRTILIQKRTEEEILRISKSEVVATAVLKSVQTPQTGSQFERDFKAFKSDLQAKADYLLNTVKSAEVVKRIFKSSLEADVLIEMVGAFRHALGASPSTDMA